MKKIFTLLFALVATATMYAQIPQLMNYQGNIFDNTNSPYTGSLQITFSIFDTQAGGTALWTETKAAVTVERGYFATVLGTTNPITLPFDKPYFLQVQVGTQTPYPRTQLVASPYAFNAMMANVSDSTNRAAVAWTVAPGAVGLTGLADEVKNLGGDLTGTLPNPRVRPEVIVNNIPAGSIGQDKLAPGVFANASGPAGGDLSGAFPNPLIALGAVKTDRIFDQAVNSQKIKDYSIFRVNLADTALRGPRKFTEINVTNSLANNDMSQNLMTGTASASISVSSPLANLTTINGTNLNVTNGNFTAINTGTASASVSISAPVGNITNLTTSNGTITNLLGSNANITTAGITALTAGNMSATSTTGTGLAVTANAIVNGNTTLGDNVNQDVVTVTAGMTTSGSITNNGAIINNNTVTNNGTVTSIGDVNLATGPASSFVVIGNNAADALTVNATTTVAGNSTINGTLITTNTVTNGGVVTNNGNVINNANTTLNGTTNVIGDAATDALTVNATTTVAGNTTVNGTLTTTNTVTNGGVVTNNGNVINNANTSLNGATNVIGDAATDALTVNATTTVAGNTTINGTLTTTNTVTNGGAVTNNGNTTLNGTTNVIGDAATDALTVNATTTVNGNASFNGATTTIGDGATGSDALTVNANSTLEGNLVANGNTTLGNATSDQINVLGSATFTPAVRFHGGVSVTAGNFNDITVGNFSSTGTFNAGGLNSQSGNFTTSVTAPVVTASTSFSTPLGNVTTVNSTNNNSTNGNITNLTVGTISATQTTGNALTVAASASITGNTTIGGNETIGGNSTVTGSLNVTGDVGLGQGAALNNINIGNTSGDNMNVNAAALFSANATFNGNATIGDNAVDVLSVNATSTFNGNTTLFGNITHNGTSAVFNNNVTVGGDNTDILTVNATSNFAGNVNVTGSASFTGAFNANTTANLLQAVNLATGATNNFVTIGNNSNDQLNVNAGAAFAGTTTFDGSTQFNNASNSFTNARVTGNLVVNTINGAAYPPAGASSATLTKLGTRSSVGSSSPTWDDIKDKNFVVLQSGVTTTLPIPTSGDSNYDGKILYVMGNISTSVSGTNVWNNTSISIAEGRVAYYIYVTLNNSWFLMRQ